MRLSASKIQVINRCLREYCLKYLENRPEPKSKALLLGSAFHAALDSASGDEYIAELNKIDPEYPWVDAVMKMIEGYPKGFPEWSKTMEREIKIENDLRICIIDGIQVDDNGVWHIVENKTRSTGIDAYETAMLPNNLQLRMYNACVPEIAERLWLEPTLYGGVKYVMTHKPTERRKAKETKEEYAARLTSDTSVIKIPVEAIAPAPEREMAHAVAMAQMAESVWSREKCAMDVVGNTASCIRYNSPCPFFDECHKDWKHG